MLGLRTVLAEELHAAGAALGPPDPAAPAVVTRRDQALLIVDPAPHGRLPVIPQRRI